MGSGGGRQTRFVHGGAGRERRRRRRSRGARSHAHWGDVSECSSSGFDSHERSSSSDDGSGNKKRKRALDNALFDLFSYQAIKSVKRDLSNLCSESDLWRENKRSKVVGKDAYSVYSVKYFFEVLHRLTLEQKAVIEKFGFGFLLSLSKTHLPSSFICWLALCVDPMCSEIIAGDKIIHFPKDAFHFVLGLPNSGSRLVEDSTGGLEFILSLFNLSEPPHITFFGNKLKSKDPLNDKQVFSCFMQVAYSCFLCPSNCNSIDTKYTAQLGDPERAARFDLCMLVHSHLMTGVSKTLNYMQSKGRKPKSFEFCSYGLAVYYLDCLDFGIHVAGSGLPRSVSWRGDMIKTYSDLDRKGRKGFGRRRMRKDLAGCYSHGAPSTIKCCAHCGSHDEPLSARQKISMHEKFDSVLPAKVIDDIFDTVHCFYSSSSVNSNNPGFLVQNVFQVLSDAGLCFQSISHIQQDHGRHSFANVSVPEVAQTPGGIASMNADENLITTAPKVPPVKKVQSKLSIRVPDGCETDATCQADLISPIGRLRLTQFYGGKDASKTVVDSAVKSFEGTKQFPIPIGVTSPEPKLVEKSPEVTITGTSSLMQRQNNLAMDTDAVYNRSLIGNKFSNVYSARKPVSAVPIQPIGIHVIDVEALPYVQNPAKDSSSSNRLIIIQPKKTLDLPLADNPRFPVSDEEIMHYCAIIDIAYTEKIQKDFAIQYHGVHCSFVSLGQTLMPGGHIDNFLIPCFCRKLFEDKHPSKSGRHYFFSYIGESILSYNNEHAIAALVRNSFLGAATASRGRKLHLSDRRANFIALWTEIFQTNEPDFSLFRSVTGKIPKQDNPNDCGVTTMMAMEHFDPHEDLCKLFSKEDIQHIRIKYANRMFFHASNQTDRSLVTNYFDKDVFMRKLH